MRLNGDEPEKKIKHVALLAPPPPVSGKCMKSRSQDLGVVHLSLFSGSSAATVNMKNVRLKKHHSVSSWNDHEAGRVQPNKLRDELIRRLGHSDGNTEDDTWPLCLRQPTAAFLSPVRER